MADGERRRLAFGKTPPLEELIFARMPILGEKRNYPRKWDQSGNRFKNLCTTTEKLRSIWKERETLLLEKRCIKFEGKDLDFMEKVFEVSDQYNKEKHLLYSSVDEKNAWFKVLFEGMTRHNKSAFQQIRDIYVSRISTIPEKYHLIDVNFVTYGQDPVTKAKNLNFIALVTYEELKDLLQLLNLEP